jgi:hypothetical protein
LHHKNTLELNPEKIKPPSGIVAGLHSGTTAQVVTLGLMILPFNEDTSIQDALHDKDKALCCCIYWLITGGLQTSVCLPDTFHASIVPVCIP